jgi:hypothetical protein
MYRREPPSRATWILEHLAAGEQDEALTGDLIEEFRAGRSSLWYWRQVLAACFVSWSSGLSARVPALCFALLWSTLAPVWYVLLDLSARQLSFEKLFDSLAPFSLIIAPIAWTIVHAPFLWAGILAYQLAHAWLGKKLGRRELRRAYWLATLILPPVYFVAFVFVTIYRYSVPGLAHARLTGPSFAHVADFGLLADIIRVPYFLALLVALWGTVRVSRPQRAAYPDESIAEDATFLRQTIAVAADLRAHLAGRFIAWMVVAGLVNACIAAILVAVLPISDTPVLGALLTRACCYVAASVAAGAVGAFAYWQGPWSPFREQSPVPFSLFVLACSSGWIWVPAMVIFSRALSAAGPLVAMIGAFALASALRRATYAVLGPAGAPPAISERTQLELFEETLYRTPADLTGYAVAISLVVAGAALAVHWNFAAGALLASVAALFAWKTAIPRERNCQGSGAYKRASVRVALLLVPAVVVTAWALLDGVAYQQGIRRPGEERAALAPPGSARATKTRTISYGSGGYTSVILWPNLPKKQVIPSIPISYGLFAPGSKQPIFIHFDGTYTYVQPPNRQPGLGAHQAHGTPLDVAIESNNDLPVVMTAHQDLPAAIPVSHCREIDVQIENRDNIPGPVSMALLLIDSSSAKPNGVYLGQQPTPSMEPMYFSIKTSPVAETLHFSVPRDPAFGKFSGVTVMFLPDIEHRFVAPKIAIEQFQLLPR